MPCKESRLLKFCAMALRNRQYENFSWFDEQNHIFALLCIHRRNKKWDKKFLRIFEDWYSNSTRKTRSKNDTEKQAQFIAALNMSKFFTYLKTENKRRLYQIKERYLLEWEQDMNDQNDILLSPSSIDSENDFSPPPSTSTCASSPAVEDVVTEEQEWPSFCEEFQPLDNIPNSSEDNGEQVPSFSSTTVCNPSENLQCSPPVSNEDNGSSKCDENFISLYLENPFDKNGNFDESDSFPDIPMLEDSMELGLTQLSLQSLIPDENKNSDPSPVENISQSFGGGDVEMKEEPTSPGNATAGPSYSPGKGKPSVPLQSDDIRGSVVEIDVRDGTGAEATAFNVSLNVPPGKYLLSCLKIDNSMLVVV